MGMTKTPEELAEEYAQFGKSDVPNSVFKSQKIAEQKFDFLAGYQAAKDQFSDTSKVMNSPEDSDSCEHILDMSKMVDVNGWISVKDRLPEYHLDVLFLQKGDCSCFVGWRAEKDQWVDHSESGMHDKCIKRGFTHWMPLPKPPREEA